MLPTTLKLPVAGVLCGLAVGMAVGAQFPFAILGAGAEGGEEAVYEGRPTSFWIRQLQDNSQAFRQEAVQALEHIGPGEEGVVRALAKMLNDPYVSVRLGTSMALLRFGPEARPALRELLRSVTDRDPFVRVYAVRALRNIGPSDEILGALCAALQDKHPVVRRVAVHSLGAFGPRAKVALPSIRVALEDKTEEVRQEATQALEQVTGQSVVIGKEDGERGCVSAARTRGANATGPAILVATDY